MDDISLRQVRELLGHFNQALGIEFIAPPDLLAAARQAIDGCKEWPMRPQSERERRLIALINSKLKLNRGTLQEFLDAAATKRVFPNYRDKLEILDCLDYRDEQRLRRWREKGGFNQRLIDHFKPISVEQSVAGLRDLLRTGRVNRSDARTCPIAERQMEILRSLFGSYVFHAFPTEAMHKHFNEDCRETYHSDFYRHLLAFHPNSLGRDCALVFFRIDKDLVVRYSDIDLRDGLCGFIAETYDRLSNHCVLAIQIQAFREGNEDGQWRLFSDLVLYAEKHREKRLKAGYFHPRKIEATTAGHIPGLNAVEARFDLANEGFFFRDCFVVARQGMPEITKDSESSMSDILLVFEKNERDETVIPCPACRSTNVAGNSYPVLGVRSWECKNSICPCARAFDRGNRYSLSSIIKQEAIRSSSDQIPERSLKRWKLDVVTEVESDAIAEMLIRHFSLHGDTIVFVNVPSPHEEWHGRRVVNERFEGGGAGEGSYASFQASHLFKRFVLERRPSKELTPLRIKHRVESAEVYQGDCFDVLFALPESSVDAAVTSPPYYNARSYSKWPNIYCYLYDMFNHARGVFRVLKPGSPYLFNIFDYFDNENSVVFSAMGKKRMILGAYVINLFRRVGFELLRNVVWHKGEIEGKRNYNQGNRSPYYQTPLNCWEHCLVFRKPGAMRGVYRFPTVLDAKPVIKIVRGENILGHTAPFPPAVPSLLIAQMARGESVIDPFSGSMTTARVAHRHGLKSISIEMQKTYCELGVRLLEMECWESTRSLRVAGKRQKAYLELLLPGF